MTNPELGPFDNPLYRPPQFAHEIRELSEESGGVAAATAEVFRRANIHIQLEGETSDWFREGNGALYVGDHQNGMESLVLLAVCGSMGREDMHFIAKPFSVQSALRASLGARAVGMTLPVIPRTSASDRDDIWNRDLYWRILNQNKLPTTDEIRQYNTASLERAKNLVAEGHAVTIYPTGGVMDATKNTWQRGLGNIIASLSDEQRHAVGVVPFKFQDLSRIRLLRALTLQSRGVAPKRQNIIMKIGKQGSIADILDPDNEAMSAEEIVDNIRRQFIERFGGA